MGEKTERDGQTIKRQKVRGIKGSRERGWKKQRYWETKFFFFLTTDAHSLRQDVPREEYHPN